MNDYKKGKEELIYIYQDSVYYPIGCLTGNSWSESAEMLSTTTRQNINGWKTSIPTSQSFSISASGLVTTSDKSGSIVTYEDLMNLKRAKTKIQWKIDSEIPGYVDLGYGYIRDLSKNAEVDSFIDFSMEIEGYGEPTRVLDTETQKLNYTLNVDI